MADDTIAEFEAADLLDNKTNDELVSFPHFNHSRIDIRTIKHGDCKTYADPYSAVDIKYTGFKYVTDKWIKFTSENIATTIFETMLGNSENICGIEEAILSMSKGEIAKIWIPSRLGYGVHGAEPIIPPNADLLLMLTLVDIYDHVFTVHNSIVENINFCTKFDNEWNQSSFDNIYNAIIQSNVLQKYPLEIVICISNFAMDELFPHNNSTKIDIRRMKSGDCQTYPDPFAAVDVKYKGYKFENKKWSEFTSTEISSTVFETRLGIQENIIGMEHALLSMSEGEKTRVWIPSRLGYGETGGAPLIPPNSDLVFEFTMVNINNDFIIEDDSSNNDNEASSNNHNNNINNSFS
eukprot:466763_1